MHKPSGAQLSLDIKEEKLSPAQPCYDLHAHSTYSDGELTPDQLFALAAQCGVDALALTDHDTVAGLSDAAVAAKRYGVELVPGAEISARLSLTPKLTLVVHLVGLYLKRLEALDAHLRLIGEARAERARQMCIKLKDRLGVDVYDSALKKAGSDASALTRSHMARALVECGAVGSIQKAFDLHLANAKPAYVELQAPVLNEVIAWIHEAGGVSVLAHPTRYGLSATNTRRLIDAFALAGGQAVELCRDSESPGTRGMINMKIREHDLLVSTASDFHGPSMPWNRLGQVPALRAGQRGVWTLF